MRRYDIITSKLYTKRAQTDNFFWLQCIAADKYAAFRIPVHITVMRNYDKERHGQAHGTVSVYLAVYQAAQKAVSWRYRYLIYIGFCNIT